MDVEDGEDFGDRAYVYRYPQPLKVGWAKRQTTPPGVVLSVIFKLTEVREHEFAECATTTVESARLQRIKITIKIG